jgi:hypothetical protein
LYNYVARVFRNYSLLPPLESNVQDLAQRFCTGDLINDAVEARECLCLVDALFQGITFAMRREKEASPPREQVVRRLDDELVKVESNSSRERRERLAKSLETFSGRLHRAEAGVQRETRLLDSSPQELVASELPSSAHSLSLFKSGLAKRSDIFPDVGSLTSLRQTASDDAALKSVLQGGSRSFSEMSPSIRQAPTVPKPPELEASIAATEASMSRLKDQVPAQDARFQGQFSISENFDDDPLDGWCHKVTVLDTRSALLEFREKLAGKRLLHVKGFGSGCIDFSRDDRMLQEQQQEEAVRALTQFSPDYMVVDGDPWGTGFQCYIKAFMDSRRGSSEVLPQLIWAKKCNQADRGGWESFRPSTEKEASEAGYSMGRAGHRSECVVGGRC